MLNYVCRFKNLITSNRLQILSRFTHNKPSTFVKFNFVCFTQNSKEQIQPNVNQNSLEQEKESWNQFLDFMLKREMYTWEDYLQQIIVIIFITVVLE